MENATRSRYEVLRREFEARLGAPAAMSLDQTVELMNSYAAKLYTRDTTPAQRHEAMEALPAEFARGLGRIVAEGNIQKGSQEMRFLAEQYGQMMSFGAEGAARGLHFESSYRNDRAITLEIVPRTTGKNELVMAYQFAADKDQLHIPHFVERSWGMRDIPEAKAHPERFAERPRHYTTIVFSADLDAIR